MFHHDLKYAGDLAFTDVVSVYSIRTVFLDVRNRCLPAVLLNIFAHRIFGRLVLFLPILISHNVVACVRGRGSIRDTCFAPFSLANVSRCHDVLRVGPLPHFSNRHSIAPYHWRYSPFPSSAGTLQHLIVLLLQRPCSGPV